MRYFLLLFLLVSTTASAVTFKWLPPTQRENGEALSISELGGYEIRYRAATENTYHRTSDTIPGNLVPGGAKEDDEDSVRTTITPPTGTIISKWLYVLTATAGLILIGATVIFIRKRILLNK